MDTNEIDRFAKKGMLLVENYTSLTFSNVKVEGLLTPYATITVYLDSRDMEIVCHCVQVGCYPLIFPAAMSDYSFNENSRSIEIRGGDGRRLREFDSEWWPFSFESRYDYERMLALICYFCTHAPEVANNSFTTDYQISIDPTIAMLDDAPLLTNVKIEEYSFTGRLQESGIYSIRFMDDPLGRKVPDFLGGIGLMQNEEIMKKMFYTENDTCKLSSNISGGLFQIKRDFQGGDSEIWSLSSKHDYEIAMQCLALIYERAAIRKHGVGTICPVCKQKSPDKTICHNCGFTNLAPIFVSKEDAEYWMANVVAPFKKRWNSK